MRFILSRLCIVQIHSYNTKSLLHRLCNRLSFFYFTYQKSKFFSSSIPKKQHQINHHSANKSSGNQPKPRYRKRYPGSNCLNSPTQERNPNCCHQTVCIKSPWTLFKSFSVDYPSVKPPSNTHSADNRSQEHSSDSHDSYHNKRKH